jgi:hypothetical protein
MDQEIVHFVRTMDRESTMDTMSAQEKKIQGFPHVFYIWKFLKRTFLSDMKQW